MNQWPTTNVRAGDIISITGRGDAYDGTYLVTEAWPSDIGTVNYRTLRVHVVEEEDTDLGWCAYFQGTGSCSFGCSEEPSCQTDRPREGWPCESKHYGPEDEQWLATWTEVLEQLAHEREEWRQYGTDVRRHAKENELINAERVRRQGGTANRHARHYLTALTWDMLTGRPRGQWYLRCVGCGASWSHDDGWHVGGCGCTCMDPSGLHYEDWRAVEVLDEVAEPDPLVESFGAGTLIVSGERIPIGSATLTKSMVDKAIKEIRDQ